MTRIVCALVVVVAAVGSACTLLLPTNTLIVFCENQDACEAGFVCEDNACLPEDTDDGSAAATAG